MFHASESHGDASDEREIVFDMLVSLGVHTRQQGIPFDTMLEAVLNGQDASAHGRSGPTAEIVDALVETFGARHDEMLETIVSAVRNHMATEMGPERSSPSPMAL